MRAISIVIAIATAISALGGNAAADPGCPGKVNPRVAAGFDKARASFCAYAAGALKLSPEQVSVSPIDVDPVVQPPERVGAAWAFYGSSLKHPDLQVRGWAVADGTVITTEQNLGVLLVEAGVWSTDRKPDASELAARVVWAMGMNHRVVGPKRLVLEKDGTGALRFQMSYRPPSPGYGGDRVFQCTVALSADRHARLSMVPVVKPNRPAPE